MMCLTIAGAEQFGCLEVLSGQRFSGKAADGFLQHFFHEHHEI